MELKDLLELIRTGGPSAIAAIMGVMWWLERGERKDCQEALALTHQANDAFVKATLERALTVISDVNGAIEDVRDLLRPRGR